MDILDAIAFGAASGAVGAAVMLAHTVGAQAQKLADHDRRIEALEDGQAKILSAVQTVKELITLNGA